MQSLRNLLSAAGQLSGRLQFFCRTNPNSVGQFYALSLLIFVRHNEILLALSNRPALFVKTGSSGFLTRFDTNRTIQSQKKATSLRFWLQIEEELY